MPGQTLRLTIKGGPAVAICSGTELGRTCTSLSSSEWSRWMASTVPFHNPPPSRGKVSHRLDVHGLPPRTKTVAPYSFNLSFYKINSEKFKCKFSHQEVLTLASSKHQLAERLLTFQYNFINGILRDDAITERREKLSKAVSYIL